jgi:CheY-like chemotaxis protein
VLVVDDVAMNRLLFSRVLHVAGADVVVASSGLEAIEVAMGGGFDLILMDVEMPGLDGPGAAKRMREQGVSSPIVAFTGHDPDDVVGEFDAVIVKGRGPKALVSRCRPFLQRPRSVGLRLWA